MDRKICPKCKGVIEGHIFNRSEYWCNCLGDHESYPPNLKHLWDVAKPKVSGIEGKVVVLGDTIGEFGDQPIILSTPEFTPVVVGWVPDPDRYIAGSDPILEEIKEARLEGRIIKDDKGHMRPSHTLWDEPHYPFGDDPPSSER